MQLRRESNGILLTLDGRDLLGAGGEARILAVPGERMLVAKLYHRPDSASERKLSAMLANPPAEAGEESGHRAIAWPLDLLHDTRDAGAFRGYLMPRVSGARPIFQFYNPSLRRAQSPAFDYRYLHRAARNLAAAVRELHGRGYVVGDINESNILVSETALVTLVDTDSFQVPDLRSGEVFRCPVGKPEFTPPELQGLHFRDIDRRLEHDLFGLAALIFMLLMEGVHPFAGQYTGGGEPPTYAERIRRGYYPHGGRQSPFRPMSGCPPINIIDPKLARLFRECFDSGLMEPLQRPDARTWQEALASSEMRLRPCAANVRHIYGDHLAACPWCARTEMLGGRDPFPSAPQVPVQRRRQGGRLPVATAGRPVLGVTITFAGIPLAPSAGSPVAGHSPTAAPAVRFCANPWSWAALAAGALCVWMLTQAPSPVSIAFGLAALCLGVLGARTSASFAGTGRWVAAVSSTIGVTASLVAAPALVYHMRLPAGVSTFSAAAGPVRSIAFSPDGRTLAVASERTEDQSMIGGQVNLWDLPTGTLRDTLAEVNGSMVAAAYAPGGRTIAAASDAPGGSGVVTLFATGSRGIEHPLAGQRGYVDAVAFSPDGRLLASGAWDRTIRIWVIPGGDLVRTVRAPDPVYSVAWSPDGSLLAAGTAFGRGSIAPGTVSVWSAADMTPLWSRRSHGNGCYQVAFSPYGRSLASGGADGIARIWDARTGKMICTLDSGGINCTCVAFSPNGHELACGSARPVGEAISNEVVVWDVASARRTRTLTGAHGAIYTVAFSNDGHAIAAGGQDGAVELWSAP